MVFSKQTSPLSWGRMFRFSQSTARLHWLGDERGAFAHTGSFLPYGLGRSYGDSCLNDSGTLLLTSDLDRFIAFDPNRGILRCESGVSLRNLLELVIPHGWFIPVTPGTCFVTAGGMVANDVHGKNHESAGTIGRWIREFELVRSDGQRLLCSASQNADWFGATIGGLGLTGLITWVEFQLKKIQSPFIDREQVRFANLEEFMAINTESEHSHEHTVAWVDCIAKGRNLGRGIFIRGNHSSTQTLPSSVSVRERFTVPIEAPNATLNPFSIRAFNALYYRKQSKACTAKTVPYTPFFYPLDAIREWNKIYGRRGFYQFQFVIPLRERHALETIFSTIASSGLGSFLAVLKTFGSLPSPGWLSFPQKGFTLALDFANQPPTLPLLKNLCAVVAEAKGRIYPAKDAMMPSVLFKSGYPRLEKFGAYVDPRFSSNFWRRVDGPQIPKRRSDDSWLEVRQRPSGCSEQPPPLQ